MQILQAHRRGAAQDQRGGDDLRKRHQLENGAIGDAASTRRRIWSAIRSASRCAFALVVLLHGQQLLSQAQPLAGDDEPTTGEAEWVTREFERRCEQSIAGDDPYLGRAMFEELGRRFASLPEEQARRAPALRMNLAYQATLQGEHEMAIGLLEQLRTDILAAAPQARQVNDVLQLLAINHLLVAEDANCLAMGSGASCILPIDPQNVHAQRAAARRAREVYEELVGRNGASSRPQWVWLLNLSAALAGFESPLPEGFDFSKQLWSSTTVERPWANVAPRLGVDGMDLSGGAVMDDFDGDGRLDLITSSWHPCTPLRAYRQRAEGGFEDVSQAWGLGRQLGGLHLVQADYDGDGRLDLLVLRGAWKGEHGRVRNSLLRNTAGGGERSTVPPSHAGDEAVGPRGQGGRGGRGEPRFVDVTYDVGLALPAYPTQAAGWADYDGDGDLDLYVANEGVWDAIDPGAEMDDSGAAFPAQLFRNDGAKGFRDVAVEAGVTNDRFAKGVAWGDVDEDGDPDLFVSNVGSDRLYRNLGDGRFEDISAAAGIEQDDRTFATWFFDHDNDGDLDLFVASYGAVPDQIVAGILGGRSEGLAPLLYRNDGPGEDGMPRLREVGEELGFRQPELVMGSNFGDIDQDGYPDLYLGTGAPIFDSVIPNRAFLNRAGLRFEERAGALGLAHLQKGHGVAFGDLDGDGDEDLLHQLGGAYAFDAFGNALFLNPSQRRYAVIRLVGERANRFGIGARVAATIRECDGAVRTIHQLVGSGGSFGGNSLQVELGLGDACALEGIEVRWPGSGTVDRIQQVELDRHYTLIEGSGTLEPLEIPPADLLRAPAVEGGAPHRHDAD